MSDEFFGVADAQKGQDMTSFVEQFEENDQKVLMKIIKSNSDMPMETITDVFGKQLEGLKNSSLPGILRENMLIANTQAGLRNIKETKQFEFFVMHAELKHWPTNSSAKVWGYFLEEEDTDEGKKTKRAPGLIIRKSNDAKEVEAFMKGLKRLGTYRINLAVQGERKMKYDATYEYPNVYFANDVADFSNMIHAPRDSMTLSKTVTQLYGIDVKTAIENVSMPNSICGITSMQSKGEYINDNDVKMLLIQPTSIPNPTKFEKGYAFNAIPIHDPSETISVFTYDDPELIDFDKDNECIIALGVIKKKPSSFSQYEMNMSAMERVSHSVLQKYL